MKSPDEGGGLARVFAEADGDPGSYPLGYRMMREMLQEGDTGARVGESTHHRARVFAAFSYYKPITRSFAFRTPVPGAPEEDGDAR
ncbi:MAG TPA: hypothetical protein VFY65_09950 [Longimicrobium sp.]|nr:hypothetical protein [Longimicrobium sp.]